MLKYDIVLNMPHSDYFVDVELKHDFLTARFQAFLFAKDPYTNKYEKVGHSIWENQFSEDDIGSMSRDIKSSKVGDHSMVHRMRFFEDADP